MIIGTWISVIVLGPGAAIVFIWFLSDLRKIFSTADKPR